MTRGPASFDLRAAGCGLAVGDYFELTNSSRLRVPPGGHFCLYALAAAAPLLPARQRQLPAADWLNMRAWSPARIPRNGWSCG